jgi:hypothetical protein
LASDGRSSRLGRRIGPYSTREWRLKAAAIEALSVFGAAIELIFKRLINNAISGLCTMIAATIATKPQPMEDVRCATTHPAARATPAINCTWV